MPKRTIRAHKGGRTQQVKARITPATKAALDSLLKAADISFGDWLENAVKAAQANVTLTGNTAEGKQENTR